MTQTPHTAPTPALLEFAEATVVYGTTRALDEISFRIDVGENVAIIGPNGSGKSTLIKAITRECYPLATDSTPPIRILGEHTWNIFSLRSMLGIVSGDLQQACTREITGREAVLSGFFGSIGLYPYHEVTDEMERRAEETLRFLDMAEIADRYLTEMSTGQARRALIGRALVHDPKALMLDEPANGLDPRASHKFSGVLRKVAQSGNSIIMVTHHLQDIIPEISRVIMIDHGKVFLDGPKHEVLTEANLSRLFAMNVEIVQRNGYYLLWS